MTHVLTPENANGNVILGIFLLAGEPLELAVPVIIWVLRELVVRGLDLIIVDVVLFVSDPAA